MSDFLFGTLRLVGIIFAGSIFVFAWSNLGLDRWVSRNWMYLCALGAFVLGFWSGWQRQKLVPRFYLLPQGMVLEGTSQRLCRARDNHMKNCRLVHRGDTFDEVKGYD